MKILDYYKMTENNEIALEMYKILKKASAQRLFDTMNDTNKFGWLSPTNKFYPCDGKLNHIETARNNSELRAVLDYEDEEEQLENIYNYCQNRQDIGEHPDWHDYEMEEDDMIEAIPHILYSKGFLRVAESNDILFFEGASEAIRAKYQLCKEVADMFDKKVEFSPVTIPEYYRGKRDQEKKETKIYHEIEKKYFEENPEMASASDKREAYRQIQERFKKILKESSLSVKIAQKDQTDYINELMKDKENIHKHLKYLDSGATRDTYDLGNGRVLKVGDYHNGREDNQTEANPLLAQNFPDLVPKAFERHPDYEWIVVEKVKLLEEQDIPKIVPQVYNFDDLRDYIRQAIDGIKSKRDLRNYPKTIVRMAMFCLYNDSAVNEFRWNNLGIVERDGQPQIVIIDASIFGAKNIYHW
jgi:hypothetical protein